MTVEVSVKITGKNEFVKRLTFWRKKIGPESASTTRKVGGQLRDRIKQDAPVETGQYRDGIHLEVMEESDSKSAVKVVTNAPQAARLEFGFVGSDSLGRYYQQAPQPHWRPAIAEFVKKYRDEMRKTAIKVMR